MKKVFQTRFGKEDGNCFAACIASLLEMPLSAVDLKGFGEDWLKSINEFLEPLGLRWLEINLQHAVNYPIYDTGGQPCVFTVKSTRYDCNHCVVGRIIEDPNDAKRVLFEIAHDPFPGGVESEYGNPIMVGFFMPTNPATMRQAE